MPLCTNVLNDKDPEHCRKLRADLENTPQYRELKHRPRIYNLQIGDDVVDQLRGARLAPTLLFVDPFGYKGLSLRLIDSVLRNWGSDCIIFFNYNRINPGLSNDMVKEHMDALFGTERAERLRGRLEGMESGERERAILEEIGEAFNEMGGRYVLPFRFWKQDGSRTSHYLILVSKSFRAYDIMKDIMAQESSSVDQGVPSFEHNPATKDLLYFEVSRPLDELEDQLLSDFAGRELTMREIYEEHSVGKRFLKNNYKQALQNLLARGAIEASPKPRKNTFADHIRASFPPA